MDLSTLGRPTVTLSRPSRQIKTSSVSRRHNDRRGQLCSLGHLQSSETALLGSGQVVSGISTTCSEARLRSPPSCPIPFLKVLG